MFAVFHLLVGRMARAVVVVRGKQNLELVMGRLAGVRRAELGMGNALGDLAYWNKDIVEQDVIIKLFKVEENGLSALCSWVLPHHSVHHVGQDGGGKDHYGGRHRTFSHLADYTLNKTH